MPRDARRPLQKCGTLDNPVALTREEIITKFNLSEENPIPIIKKSRKKSEEPAK